MDKDRMENLKAFERILGYVFNDRSLLDTALIHRSFINENQNEAREDNERMEFLGDARPRTLRERPPHETVSGL